jgi:hypothetical protein
MCHGGTSKHTEMFLEVAKLPFVVSQSNDEPLPFDMIRANGV